MKNNKLKKQQPESSSSARDRMSEPDERTLFYAEDDEFDVESIDIDTALEDFEDVLEEEVRHTLSEELDDDFIDDLENHLMRELQDNFGGRFGDVDEDDFIPDFEPEVSQNDIDLEALTHNIEPEAPAHDIKPEVSSHSIKPEVSSHSIEPEAPDFWR